MARMTRALLSKTLPIARRERPHASRVPPPHRRGAEVDVEGLAAVLRERIDGEVRFHGADRALYATDAGNYRHLPIGVVIPRTTADVVRTVAVCREFGAPIVSREGGTSIGGQCVNVAVVLDFSKHLNRILWIDPGRRLARVQPGVVRDRLAEAAAAHGLTFGPDTATHPWATMGGMIGNNSCGVHSVMAGRTVDNVHELDVLTYDGTRLSVGPTSAEDLEAIRRQGGREGEILSRLEALRDQYADRIRRTGSAAGSRSSREPAGAPFTWRRFCSWPCETGTEPMTGRKSAGTDRRTASAPRSVSGGVWPSLVAGSPSPGSSQEDWSTAGGSRDEIEAAPDPRPSDI